MPRPIVPDTTFLIALTRRQESLHAFIRNLRTRQMYISSVVIAELYAGARSQEDAALVDPIVRAASCLLNRLGRRSRGRPRRLRG